MNALPFLGVLIECAGTFSVLLAYVAQFAYHPLRALRYDTMPSNLQRIWRLGFAFAILGLMLVLWCSR